MLHCRWMDIVTQEPRVSVVILGRATEYESSYNSALFKKKIAP